jgi:hypothetical protein
MPTRKVIEFYPSRRETRQQARRAWKHHRYDVSSYPELREMLRRLIRERLKEEPN